MTHHFNAEFAELFGLEEAILFENLYFWCLKNKVNNRNFFDGNYWTYNSVKAFSEMFKYMTPKKIYNALKNLENEGLIVSGCYNSNKYDRTKWYAITDKGNSVYQNDKIQNSIQKNDLSKKENDTLPKRGMNVTDNKPDNKPDNKLQIDNNDTPSQHKDVNNFNKDNEIRDICLVDIQDCYKSVYERWIEAGLPLSTGSKQNYFTFSCRELKTALSYWAGKGLKPEEIFQALENYIKVSILIKNNESWMEQVGNFEFFAKKTTEFLDGNFNLDRFKRNSLKQQHRDEKGVIRKPDGTVDIYAMCPGLEDIIGKEE